MKSQLIASAIALIAFTNIGTAQEGAKPKKVNPAKPSLHRPPPPTPVFVPPVIVADETCELDGKAAPALPAHPFTHKMVEVAPPPPLFVSPVIVAEKSGELDKKSASALPANPIAPKLVNLAPPPPPLLVKAKKISVLAPLPPSAGRAK